MTQNQARYKQVAEVVSAIAVIMSLVFVGFGVRETARQTELNTDALRVAAYQDLVAQISRFNEVLLDPELAALCLKMQDPEGSWSDLTPVGRPRQACLSRVLG